MTSVHIVGAGLAGLAAAVRLAEAGRRVVLYEAGPAAGGRCRSYFDRELGCRLDNGNHLLLSGNGAALAYLDTIGARATFLAADAPRFPFIDLASGERWTLAPNRGRIPWWLFLARRRVPGTRFADYLALLRLHRAAPDATVAAVLDDGGVLWRRLIEPLAVAALNTPPAVALASLLRPVIDETLLAGGAACIPLLPREGLSESFVDPALAFLAARGSELRTGQRVAGLETEGGHVAALHVGGERVALDGADCILATPPWVAGELVPGLVVPDGFQPILNVHYRIAAPDAPPLLGVIGGTVEWVFAKPEVVSVTVSAAERLIDEPADALAARCWPEVCTALGLAGPMPPVRVVKERRATVAATAAQEARRPGAATAFANLLLAGDWTATGLPGTIEGAIRSGRTAAERLLGGLKNHS